MDKKYKEHKCCGLFPDMEGYAQLHNNEIYGIANTHTLPNISKELETKH